MVITYRDFKKTWTEKLNAAGIENADFEISELLGYALNSDCRSSEFADLQEKQAEQRVTESFEELCERRLSGEPLQYILGEWEFYGLPFKVGRGVLIPRQDTETLVDVALKILDGRQNLTVVDLCSGSGCLGIALEKNLNCKQILCIEKSQDAAKYLSENIALNSSKARLLQGDIFDEKIIQAAPMADLIICNPPYVTAEEMENLQREVTFEPREALFGGEDGLDYYRKVTRLWKNKLNENGALLFEIGQGQEDEVMQIMIQLGFGNVRTRPDLTGINRCVYGTIKSSTKKCTDVLKI